MVGGADVVGGGGVGVFVGAAGMGVEVDVGVFTLVGEAVGAWGVFVGRGVGVGVLVRKRGVLVAVPVLVGVADGARVFVGALVGVGGALMVMTVTMRVNWFTGLSLSVACIRIVYVPLAMRLLLLGQKPPGLPVLHAPPEAPNKQ